MFFEGKAQKEEKNALDSDRASGVNSVVLLTKEQLDVDV
jgi:hypothetical protein